MIIRILMLALALAVAGCRAETTSALPSMPDPPVSEAGLDLVRLQIRSGDDIHHFVVEVARSPAEQARGLMYRQSLAPDRGMIFPFAPPRPASFWMKNTLIPLDMIFVRADGTIAEIAANTVPLSLEQVAVNEPVAAVLELAAGRAGELGIRPGDRVVWND